MVRSRRTGRRTKEMEKKKEREEKVKEINNGTNGPLLSMYGCEYMRTFMYVCYIFYSQIYVIRIVLRYINRYYICSREKVI